HWRPSVPLLLQAPIVRMPAGAGSQSRRLRSGPLRSRAAYAAARLARGRDRRAGDRKDRTLGLRIFATDILAPDRALRFLAVQRLIFEQGAGEPVEFVEILGQDRARGALGLLDQAADLLVDQLGGFLRHILVARDAVAEEDFLLIVA